MQIRSDSTVDDRQNFCPDGDFPVDTSPVLDMSVSDTPTRDDVQAWKDSSANAGTFSGEEQLCRGGTLEDLRPRDLTSFMRLRHAST